WISSLPGLGNSWKCSAASRRAFRCSLTSVVTKSSWPSKVYGSVGATNCRQWKVAKSALVWKDRSGCAGNHSFDAVVRLVLCMQRRCQFAEGTDLKRRGKDEALGLDDATRPQVKRLLFRLHPFGDDFAVEVLGHGNEAVQHRNLPCARLDHVDEYPIDLDDVAAQRADIGQVRMARPGVVQREFAAQRMQTRNHAMGHRGIAQRVALGDLEHQLL